MFLLKLAQRCGNLILGHTDVIVLDGNQDAADFAEDLGSAMKKVAHERTLKKLAEQKPDGNHELKEIL